MADFDVALIPSEINLDLELAPSEINLDLQLQKVIGLAAPDDAYEILDLSTKVLGNVPASQAGGFIEGAIALMQYTRVGRTVSGNVTIVVPASAIWPSGDPFFPIAPIAIKASDLPFAPRTYAAVSGIAPPQVGGFGLFNVNWFDEEEVPHGEGFSVGSVITDFGGSLPDGGIFTFFHAGNNTVTQLANLVYDGNFVGLQNRDVVIYNRFEYEAAEAA